MATGLVNGERQILTPYRIETSEPIDIKFGVGDYVRETTLYAKFGANPSTRGFWANRWNLTLLTFYLFIYLYILFSSTQLQVIPLNGFWCAVAQKTRFHAWMCLLGVKKVEINIEPLLCPKGQILAKSGLRKFHVMVMVCSQDSLACCCWPYCCCCYYYYYLQNTDISDQQSLIMSCD